MDPMEQSYSTYSCATLRFLSDADRDMTVPAGVVLWSNDGRWHRFRLPEEDEKIPDLPAKARHYLSAVQAQIEGWIKSGHLPYEPEPFSVLSRAWWEHVQKLLQFSVRVDTIRLLAVDDPEEEIETLFEALVQPRVSRRAQAERIDRAVAKALGTLSSYFSSHTKVTGFGNRPVKVLRLAASLRDIVIIEAVNLATHDAETEADALFGRISRIQAGLSQQKAHFVLGYLASPHGLNGEKALKEFIENRIETRMYDLDREKDEFQEAAYRERAPLDDNLPLFPALTSRSFK